MAEEESWSDDDIYSSLNVPAVDVHHAVLLGKIYF
jgi:hypothetical protein